jgi:hypothetical protein
MDETSLSRGVRGAAATRYKSTLKSIGGRVPIQIGLNHAVVEHQECHFVIIFFEVYARPKSKGISNFFSQHGIYSVFTLVTTAREKPPSH